MDLTFPLLVDRPSEIPRIAKWWCDEWGLPPRHASFDDYVRELATLTADALPLHVLAEREGSPVGVATLKFKEPHAAVAGRSHWLSGVYVEPSVRGQGIASALCRQIETLARARTIADLYLETERLDGGLYQKLGWRPLRQLDQDGVAFLVMVKDVGSAMVFLVIDTIELRASRTHPALAALGEGLLVILDPMGPKADASLLGRPVTVRRPDGGTSSHVVDSVEENGAGVVALFFRGLAGPAIPRGSTIEDS